jgi:acyl-CoA synthetase (AMP-forming)/AMP-acid ligase II
MEARAFDTDDLATVDAVLDRAADLNGDVEAYVEPALEGRSRRSMTFRQWRSKADATAALLADLGVRADDVVCLVLPPSIEFAVLYQAIVRLGAITTGINPRMGDLERASIFDRMRPALTVIEDGAGRPGLDAGLVVTLSEVADPGDRPRPATPPRTSSAPVAVVWTSGTTGLPKGALFDHQALRAVATGTDVLSQPGDRRLSPLPFSHVSYVTRAWDEIANAITTVISPAPWRAETTLAAMIAEDVTVAQGVPTQWSLLMEHEELAAAHLPHLRLAGTGAARMAPSQVRELSDRLGVPVVVRYTSTETSLGTGTRPGDADEVVALTVGRPVPGVEMLLVDGEGHAVAPGEVGRVRLRSAAVMRGYVGNRADLGRGVPPPIDPGLTASVRDDEGWITTGDFGCLDEAGNLMLVGRDNELYQRGGYNVYPAEVEQALDGADGVDQVAVVAGDDPVLGEVGVAFVVAKPDGPPPTLEELRTWLAGRLADYKAPEALVVLEVLPVTPMGKVDKRALKVAADEAAQRRSAERAEARRTASEQAGRDFGNDVAAQQSAQETT